MNASVANLSRRRTTLGVSLVRRLTQEDVPQLMALCAELAEEQALPAESLPRLDLLEALFDVPVRTWVWVAEEHGQLVGFIAASAGLAFPQQRYHLSIDALYVSAPWRECGIADALVDYARECAVELDCVQFRGPHTLITTIQGPQSVMVTRSENAPVAKLMRMR